MTDQPTAVTLDEVRERFLGAEARLQEAATAVEAIRTGAEGLVAARESLGAAGLQLANLSGSLGEIADSLTENATELRQGVEAIRLGDPAAIRREIEELDQAFTAMQSVLMERLGGVDAQIAALATRLDETAAVAVTQASAARRERLLVGAGLAILVVIAIVVRFVG